MSYAPAAPAPRAPARRGAHRQAEHVTDKHYGNKERGERIRQARLKAGLSQAGLGDLMRPKRKQTTVSAWEKGARDLNHNDWDELARILETPLSVLQGDDPLGELGLEITETWSTLSPELREEVVRYARYLAERARADEEARAAEQDDTNDDGESTGSTGARSNVSKQSSKGSTRPRRARGNH